MLSSAFRPSTNCASVSRAPWCSSSSHAPYWAYTIALHSEQRQMYIREFLFVLPQTRKRPRRFFSFFSISGHVLVPRSKKRVEPKCEHHGSILSGQSDQPVRPAAPSTTTDPNPYPIDSSHRQRLSTKMCPGSMLRCRYRVGGASGFSLAAHAVPSKPLVQTWIPATG